MAAAQTNGPDPKRTKECVDRIENLFAKKAELHMAYMAECAVIAGDVKDIYTEAKSAWGIPTRALKTVIKARGMERKLDALRDDLEGDDQESFDQIRLALGDLADSPLGQAALDKADGDVRPAHLKRRESDRKKDKAATNEALDAAAAAENVARLSGADGIRPLN